MKKIICFAAAGLLLTSMESMAHRIEYYTSNGCIVPGSPLVIDAEVTYAPSNTNYRWQYKTTSGAWTCFNSGSNTINGTAFTVSNVSGTGANNAPALTIASPTAALDDVQVRCLMRESASPCNAPSGTTWGGDDLNLSEVKVLRLRYNAASGACAIACENNVLSNNDGYYGGFEAVAYSSGNFTNENFLSGAGSTDFSGSGSGAGSYRVMNNPYAAYSSFAKFAPHSGNYQMIVKGSGNVADDVWYKTVTVTPGEVYSFSVWVSKVDGTTPRIQLKANSVELGAAQITATAGTWTQVTGTYAVPPGVTSVTFTIRDKDASSAAHNYVLDDICLVKTATPISIGDKVWFDVNRDGRQDAGEAGISGVTVKLFYDNNGDNVADSTNPTYTATTNGSGNYTFSGVIPGKYFVQFTLASGYDAFTTQDAAGVPVGENSTANVTTGKTGTHNFTANYMMKDAGMVKNFGITGKVYNDVNGLTNNTVDGTLISAQGSTALQANLFKGSVFVATTPVSSGTYTFSNLPGNTNYTVVISTVAGTASSTPSSVLVAGWVNTGEFIGTGAGNDGTVDGQLSVSLTTSGVSNANFGVEQLPTPANNTAAGQNNPGGTNSVTVPSATFGGTDPSSGTITSLRITSFPTGATSITINGTNYTSGNFPAGGVTVPTNTTGQPTQTITVDPAAEGNTSVVITYKVTDNAGKESTTSGTATVPFIGYTISGKVFNDVNGLTDNTVNGTGIGTVSAQQLKAYLVKSSVIADSTNVAADGTYTFDNAAANTNYTVIITTVNAAIGAATPAVTLPAGWVNTGEFIGTGAGNDATVDGILAVNVTTGNIANANFGMEQLPTPANNTAAGQTNPGGTNSATVPSATFGGTDPSSGTITSLRITSFPTGATSITINGTNYTSGNFPAGGVTVPTNTTGQPTQTITVDPAGEGATTVTITYKVTDNAGKESTTTGTATVPFTGLTISGKVFNDVNGLTDNTINGTGIGTVSAQQLKAYLVKSGTIADSTNVAADGTYTFDDASGNTNYTVLVTTVNAAIGAAAPAVTLPAGWVIIGEFIGTGAGNDGTADGILAVNVTTSNVSNANFGMEQLPTPANNTAAGQVNPGGTNSATVPSATFGGTDPSSGTITSLRITSFPTGATSITINGTNYTSGNFPAAGVSVPTNATGQPTQTITVDPAGEGATTVTITYKVTDNAGKESTTTGTATVPFTGLTISGKVFNDVNGMTNLMVDGTGIGIAGGQQLKAYLTKTTGSTVVGVTNVAADGTFSFDNASGNTSYTVILSTATAAIGSSNPAITLPAGWVNTGEFLGTGNGSDGNANGALAVTIATSNVSNANFAIEERPTAGISTAAAQVNPGDTISVTVPAATFVSSDVAPGTVTSIKITALPTNANSLTVGSVKYTSVNFPAGGVVIPTNTSGQPTQVIKVDPVDGTVTASIPFQPNDNANVLSANTGAAKVPVYELPDLTPIITVAPTTMYGTTNFVTRVDVYNLAQDTASNGLITVYVTKSALINYTFNPTMTSAAGSSVQNNVWTMDATSNSSYYLFTTNTPIEPQAVLSFGLNGTLTPGATQGQLTNTSVIYPGSGSETNFINNTDAETINYFSTN